MSGRYLLRGGCVLTLGSRTSNLVVGDLLIEDGRVAEVGEGLRSRSAEAIDVSDTIVMPGFVDSHRHSWRTLFRNAGSFAHFGESLTPEDAYAAALAALGGALEAGITTIADWIDPGSEEAAAAILDAHRDSGARSVAILSSSLSDETMAAARDRALERTTLAYGAESDTLDTARQEWAAARTAGWRIHHHLGLTADGPGRAAALGQAGLLGADVTLIHCSSVDEHDLEALRAGLSSVVLTPAAEMASGLGAPPIQRLIDHGIRPGLGIDDESTAPGDMFAQMRATNSFQHASMFDIKLSGRAGVPQALTTRDVIKYATIDGAAALGMADSIGSLEVGKQADIVVLRADRPNIHPVNDPIGAVVWGMDTSNIDLVFVAGDPVVRGGSLVDGGSRARDLARAAQGRVLSARGSAGGTG